MASSDSNIPDAAWARHYAEAAARRRERGLHRRADGARRHTPSRMKLYLTAGGLFLVLTVVALLLPR